VPKTIGVWVMNIIRATTVLWLVVHFILILIYTLPTTPIESTLEPFLDATIGTYFDQGWNLFAPGPVDTDFALLIRPLSNDEFKVAGKGLPNNGWYDISSPVWAKQGNIFSAYPRLSNVITQATLSYDNQPSQEPLKLMVKFASAFCKDIGKSNVSYIALMIRERHSVPWPEGKAPKPPAIKTKFVGIYRMDRSVENINLYQI
jgi:hypothetical protein